MTEGSGRPPAPKTADVPPTPPEGEPTGDHGPDGDGVGALVADDGDAPADGLMDDPRPSK